MKRNNAENTNPKIGNKLSVASLYRLCVSVPLWLINLLELKNLEGEIRT